MRRTHLLLAATIGLGALSGCGGDDSISKADFVKKANAICRKGDADLQKATSGLGQNSSKDEVVSAIKDKVVPNIQGQIDDIRGLGFPKADKDKLDGILDDAESVLGKVKDDPEGMMNSSDPFASINKSFVAYGLKDCGSS
jgi:hypothetical protein